MRRYWWILTLVLVCAGCGGAPSVEPVADAMEMYEPAADPLVYGHYIEDPSKPVMTRSTVLYVAIDGEGLSDLLDSLPPPNEDAVELVLDVQDYDGEVLLQIHRSGEIIVCGEQVAFDPEGCERVWRVMTVGLRAYGYNDGKIMPEEGG